MRLLYSFYSIMYSYVYNSVSCALQDPFQAVTRPILERIRLPRVRRPVQLPLHHFRCYRRLTHSTQ